MRPTRIEPLTLFANRALDSGELFLRRRPLYPAEVRDHVLKILILQGFRGFSDSSPWCLGVVFANQEGRFLISFSNFGGRTFSYLLILTFGSGASE